jgi:hypothetical protein
MGISCWFLIGSRLVAGLGTGIIGCLFGDIVKTTTKEERTKILSRIMMSRQVDLIKT